MMKKKKEDLRQRIKILEKYNKTSEEEIGKLLEKNKGLKYRADDLYDENVELGTKLNEIEEIIKGNPFSRHLTILNRIQNVLDK